MIKIIDVHVVGGLQAACEGGQCLLVTGGNVLQTAMFSAFTAFSFRAVLTCSEPSAPPGAEQR